MNPTQKDLQTFRAALYSLAAQKAKHLTGTQVMLLLKEVSEEIYTAGIDQALRNASLNLENLADAFDYTWLSLLIVKLNKKP